MQAPTLEDQLDRTLIDPRIEGEFKPALEVVGGMKVGPDRRVHTTFTHNPSSLRLSSTDPNLQNIPRPSGLGKMVKEIFVAPDGYMLWEADFSAIEAVLVGYFAGDPTYYRFAKLGIHDYVASHMLGKPMDMGWSDADIKAAAKEIKTNHLTVRDTAKRIVHGSNYMMTPRKVNYEFPEYFPTIKAAAELQGLYFELFPSIPRWHRELADRVDGTRRKAEHLAETGADPDPWTLGVAHVRNPFGYVHRFYNVLDWEKVGGEWFSTYGEDAKRLVSFLPQSTASAILKRAAKRVWYEQGGAEGPGGTFRLFVHDSIVGEVREAEAAKVVEAVTGTMTEPIPELPLDPAWGLGEYVTIGVEAKVGKSWAGMH